MKEKLVNHQKVSKCYENDCPEILLSLFIFLLKGKLENTIWKTLMMGDIHLSPKLKKYFLINAFYVYNHQNGFL